MFYKYLLQKEQADKYKIFKQKLLHLQIYYKQLSSERKYHKFYIIFYYQHIILISSAKHK